MTDGTVTANPTAAAATDGATAAPAATTTAAPAPAAAPAAPASTTPAQASSTTADGSSSSAATGSPAAAPAAAPADAGKVSGDGKTADAAPPAKEATKESTPSLLEAAKSTTAEGAKPDAAAADKKPEPAKAADAKPDKGADKAADGTAPVEKAQADTPPQPRSYAAFTLPEGVKLDDKQVEQFTGLLDDPKLDHQQRAQSLVDLYLGEMRRVHDDAVKHQREYWANYQAQQIRELRNDPEFSGRIDTVLGNAKSVIEQFGGTKEQQAELWRLINPDTGNGMGNNRNFVRLLNNMFEVVGEGTLVPGGAPGNAGPKQSRADRWYGAGKGNGAAAG